MFVLTELFPYFFRCQSTQDSLFSPQPALEMLPSLLLLTLPPLDPSPSNDGTLSNKDAGTRNFHTL